MTHDWGPLPGSFALFLRNHINYQHVKIPVSQDGAALSAETISFLGSFHSWARVYKRSARVTQLHQKQLHRGRDMSAGDGWGLMLASAFISPSGRWVELGVRGQNTGKMRTIKVSLKEEVWELGRKTQIKEVDPSQHLNAPRAAFKAARAEKAVLLETSNVKSVQQCKAGRHGYREALLWCSALRELKVVCDWSWGGKLGSMGGCDKIPVWCPASSSAVMLNLRFL